MVEVFERLYTDRCKSLARGGGEVGAELEQLLREVVESEMAVVERASGGVWIRWVIELGVHSAGSVEAACDANIANGVEAVGILQDASLKGSGNAASGVAVGANSVADDLDTLQGPA